MTDLLATLRVSRPLLISIVGSGGKTSLMFALAAAAVEQGSRVLTTTTTRILPPRPDQCTGLILSEDAAGLTDKLTQAFESQQCVTAAVRQNEQNKLIGFSPEVVDRLFEEKTADLILVEADGARNLPLKAPGLQEPVIPETSGLVIAVVGLSGLGRPLNEAVVFRPEIFARLSGLALGESIDAAHAARVVFHAQGHFQKAPPRSRRTVFLNQADRMDEASARQAAEAFQAIGAGRCERVIWGSLKNSKIEWRQISGRFPTNRQV